jgi:hypothetical protein
MKTEFEKAVNDIKANNIKAVKDSGYYRVTFSYKLPNNKVVKYEESEASFDVEDIELALVRTKIVFENMVLRFYTEISFRVDYIKN